MTLTDFRVNPQLPWTDQVDSAVQALSAASKLQMDIVGMAIFDVVNLSDQDANHTDIEAIVHRAAQQSGL